MPLFQKSVTNKYLKNIDNNKLNQAFLNFKDFYGDKLRLHNIMQLKEENYQEGFLREIFVETLGYTINPNVNYNLTTEYKNQTDAGKADGAIIKDEKAIGVIELKSTKTKNLESIKEQAFRYKNNQPECRYVITSNFQSLRFYLENATEYEEFNLFELAATAKVSQRFKLLYLLLSKESILSDLPLKLSEETKFHESNISDKLYADYKHFKDAIFQNLVKNNPQYDKLTLFKKSQKLLDRFLFVLFAEDGGLIPPNAISKIIEQWKMFKANDEYFPLYSRFQKLFSHLDKGYTYEKWGEIPAYNGGLFRKDELLDNPELKIDDDILLNDSKKLSSYDFNTEVDVNILGHIFEHSLNEIEEITAELQGEKTDKSKSKRKKDGIYYTPKYITKYIVENTVGTLCEEKKKELQLSELLIDDSYRKKDGKLTAKAKKLFDTLETYKKWMLGLKVLDPACGSGAFLNQALDFFIGEHNWIADRIQEITGDASRMYVDTDKAILENNIYGVDINEESVEIAKLSLWLRTAQKGRPLSILTGNIKCGNSLIDDPEVAGDKAFDWKLEFEEIMDDGGFDIVIGNPPWGAKVPKNQKTYINTRYLCNKGEIETYVHFTDIAINTLIKEGGFLGFITPNTWYYLGKYIPIRVRVLQKELKTLIELDKRIFIDAPDIVPAIFIIKNNQFPIKSLIKTYKLKKGEIPTYLIDDEKLYSNNIDPDDWRKLGNLLFNLNFTTSLSKIILKIQNNSSKLMELFNVRYGIKTGNNSKYVKKKIFVDNLAGNWKNCIAAASSVKRYKLNWELDKLDFGSHLAGFSNKSFEKRKILIQYIRKLSMERRLITTIDDDGKYYPLNNFSFIEEKADNIQLKYLLPILNSQMMNFYFKNVHIDYNIKPKYLEILPVKNISIENQQPFIEKADLMLSLNEEQQTKTEKFLKRIKANLEVDKITNKLQNFYDFDFKTFVAELKKQKISLNLKQQDEWEDYFDSYKKELNDLQNQINQTDNEIDKMVYELYELTHEEIEIVENSVK